MVVVINLDDLEAMITRVINECMPKAIESTEKTEQPELVDTSTLMQRLNVSAPTIRKWRKKKKIPSIMVGASVRFDYNEVLKSLKK